MHTNVCKHCRKVFISRFKLHCCNECKPVDDILFERIRDYLIKYPNSSAIQIADALELSAFTVIDYINEGRLVVSNGSFERLS